MTHAEKARRFRDLHVKGDPLVLYNIWDAGTARAVCEAGAPAVATGSWSVAGAHGYADGEAIPFQLLCTIAARIAAAVDAPVSIDAEGGFAVEPPDVAVNIATLAEVGAVGVNFEDQIVGGDGLHDIARQCARIAAIRAAADPAIMFINARTDVFLKADPSEHSARLDDALARAKAYAEAGADGVFVPGLVDDALIAQVCAACPAPVNVMATSNEPPLRRLAELGVARVSFGPAPFRAAMQTLRKAAEAIYAALAS